MTAGRRASLIAGLFMALVAFTLPAAGDVPDAAPFHPSPAFSLGGPLSDGLLGGTTLVCPLHDNAFDLRTGAPLTGNCPLRTYPVRATEDGRIMLERVAEPAE